MSRILYLLMLLCAMSLTSCKHTKTTTDNTATLQPCGPVFNADSAYAYCSRQCDFGPRTMNTKAHDDCRDWIASEFRRHGMEVAFQEASLKGYDGTMLSSTNIIARYTPQGAAPDMPRLLLCAHYDTRPWADNDPDEKNHKTPVMGANDGASGIAVMLEVARLLSQADTARMAVDFVCFDAEDYGTPQWFEGESQVSDPWALGAQHWASEYAAGRYPVKITCGILLDMVGGEGTKFYQEGMSVELAGDLTSRVWQAAEAAGVAAFFPKAMGGYVTDDHVPVNNIAGIPCVDIIPYYKDCPQSSFGLTWHTVSDTIDHISRETLRAAGQAVIQFIYQ
ncbi:MAG: M28 family peptidase [Prevotella sp.]